MRSARIAGFVFAGASLVLLTACPAVGQEGVLQTLRQDVREGPPRPPASSEPPTESREPPKNSGPCQAASPGENSDADGSLFFGALLLGGIAITSPFWGPYALLEDDFGRPGYFRSFPYDGGPGYITCTDTRPWAARLSFEHVETFDNIENTGGRLLVSTTSRFGVDVGMNRLDEQLPGRRFDRLWLGDCNFVLRFAQGEWGEFRTGLGFNWLDDASRTDFGFNFTYGADLYPRKPWIVSANLDWGTLGRAELFRFRTTVGVMINRVEVYTGYEYADIERTRWNGLVGGVRLWF